MSREIVAFSVSAGLAIGRMQWQQQPSTTSIHRFVTRRTRTAREDMATPASTPALGPTGPYPHEPERPRAPGRPETSTTVLCCDF